MTQLVLSHGAFSAEPVYLFLLSDCRADLKSWITLAGTYKIVDTERTDITAMQSPPAFLVHDEQRVEFDVSHSVPPPPPPSPPQFRQSQRSSTTPVKL